MTYDIAIIGAGSAGMTAALYALRANKKILLLESTIFGGQILQTPLIENYPALPNVSGEEFSSNLHSQIQSLGQKITYQTVLNVLYQNSLYQIQTKNQIYQSKTIILATGTVSRKLNLPNEDQLIGKGVAYCATCDGPLYKDQNVAVVGGGNSAILSTLYLSELCQNVFLIHHSSHFRAENLLLQKLSSRPNIYIIPDNEITSLNSTNEVLSSITLKNKLDYLYHSDLSKQDRTATPQNIYHAANQTLNINALFIEIGRIFPSTAILKNVILNHQIDIDSSNFIITDSDCKTKLPGFFAAGDCRSKSVRQLVTATSDGAITATSAIKFLS